MREISNKRYSKMLAVVLALVVAFSYSIPMSVFAETDSNTASVVNPGGELYYDKDGNPVDDWNNAAVEVSKEIEKLSGDNEFQINLKVQTKSQVQVTNKAKDAATILAIDLSSSMASTSEGYEAYRDEDTRLYAAKQGALKFLESYVKNAGDAKREISIVIFAGGVKRYLNWTDANDKQEKGFEAVNKAINDIGWDDVPRKLCEDDYAGWTNIHGGLMLSRNLLTVQNIKDISNKNVVVLTDGVPNMYSGNTYNQNHVWGYNRQWSNDSYDDVPAICNDIKGLGSNIYSVCYGVEEQLVYIINSNSNYETISINNWLNNRAKVTKNYNVDNASELYRAFENISEEIKETINTSNLEIIDPMGKFILFDAGNKLDSYTTFSKDTINWKPVVEIGQENNEVKTYTYSYKVKLDVANQLFEEGKAYDANGTTTLTFKYGNNPEPRNVNFPIPSVKGIVPEVPYTIEYYKWDKTTKNYPTEPTEVVNGGTAKLWSQVNAPEGYDQKYTSDNYHFVQGDSVLQLDASQSGTVLKLKYMPDLADVTVKHYYKTDVINADGSKTKATEYELKSTVTKDKLYAGDRFGAELISELDGVKYTLNDEKSDDSVVSSLPKEGKTINLYYDGVQDLRKTTSITVNRIYKTESWKLNNDTGRYEKIFTLSIPQEYEKNTEVKAHSTFATSTVNDVTPDYSFEGADKGTYDPDKQQVTLALGEEANVINMTFTKRADESTLTKANVIVKHNYYLTEKKIVDGKLVTVVPATPVVDKKEYTNYYADERFTPEENLSYNGNTYTADSENANKIKAYVLSSGNLEINLSYHCTLAPEATSVKVNHIYRTYSKVYKETVNQETKVVTGRIETVEKIDGNVCENIDKIKVGDAEEKLYVGFVYTANKNGGYKGNNYTFNEKESTADGKITLGQSGNEINLYYDINEDTRDAADIEVHHVYKTKLTTVENGRVVTKDVVDYKGIRDKDTDKYTGKAGDPFKITTHEELDGKKYTITSKIPESIVLRPGTNDTIEITYEREHSDLKATALKVVHKYVEKAMTVVKGVAEYYDEGTATVAEVGTFTVDGGKTLPGEIYVGEKYTVDMVPMYKGVTYTADSANPGTDITLADVEGGNTVEYKYIHKTELPKTSVVVNHHYSHNQINSVGESTVTTEDNTVTMPQPYVGANVTVGANEAGYTFSKVTVSGTETYNKDTQNGLVLTVSNAAVTVDYYYTKVTDNSVASSWKINHYYRTMDWNDNADKPYALDQVVSSSANSYATKTITGVPNLKPDDAGKATFTLDKATSTPKFAEGYTITLEEGANNEINFYYTQKIDSRVGTVVKVVHNYYKHDTSGLVHDTVVNPETSGGAVKVLPGVLAGTYEEVFTGKTENAWVGNKFTAEKKTVYGEGENALTYQFKDANPENCTINYLKLADTENPNLIIVNYVYNYDASENVVMKVNHVYKTHDSYTDKTTDEVETVMVKFGNEQFGNWNKLDKVFTAKEMAKSGFARQTSNDNMAVSYNAGENQMTIVYTKDISTKPSTGGGGGGNHKPNNPGTTPSTNIPDEAVPLVDNPVIIEDQEVPLTDTPIGNKEQVILDEKVPLTALPKTGGSGMLGYFGVGAALLALGAIIRRKEEKQ